MTIIHKTRPIALLALAALAVIAVGCVKTAVRNDAAAGGTAQMIDTVQAAAAATDTINGTFTDPRDGKSYRTVKIGNSTWMAENLNYKTERSKCYGNADSNCTKYGRLYDWGEAMKACPATWRLPTKEDWDRLDTAVGGDWKTVGKKLKSTTGWNDWECSARHLADTIECIEGEGYSGNGTDEFGFSALPGGGCAYSDFSHAGNLGYWWSATEYKDQSAWYNCIQYDYDYLFKGADYRKYMLSVRCLKAPARKDAAAAAIVQTVDTVKTVADLLGTGGRFTDARDGKTYRTVKIGNAIWMAENLNFETHNSWCYKNDESYCQKYGRLYNWNDAMNACPAGWRVPGDEDWDNLAMAVGGVRAIPDVCMDIRWKENYYWLTAGARLKSTTGWADWEDFHGNTGPGNGTDEFGFSALPGGKGFSLGQFDDAGKTNNWWSSVEDSKSWSWYRTLSSHDDHMFRRAVSKQDLQSLRCLKDSVDLR